MSYKLEKYEDHIRRVLQAFQELVMPELRFPAKALEQAAFWTAGSIIRAAWLVCLLHDVGKLSNGWQGWARAYQKQVGNAVRDDFAIAHTDNEWNNPKHREAEKAVRIKHPKPHHAGEGALSSALIFKQALGQECPTLFQAALTAVVRHHTPFATECNKYTLEPQAESHIRATLQFIPEEVQRVIDLKQLKPMQETSPTTFANLLVTPDKMWGWLAYLLLARALRRADQEGTARGSKEG